jgi:hypothetical protein
MLLKHWSSTAKSFMLCFFHVDMPSLKQISIPSHSEELAELSGIILGDGNVQAVSGKKVGTYCVRIAGDALEGTYLLGYVLPLCRG